MIELLVVLWILSLLAAILVPAVQAARESSRRIQCLSNLRQIGQAVHEYHDSCGRLPPTILLPPDRAIRDDGFSWSARILPFCDQANLYANLGLNQWENPLTLVYERDGSKVPGGEIPLTVFRCPSSVMPARSQQMDPGFLPLQYHGYGATDYLGSGGSDLAFGAMPSKFAKSQYVSLQMISDGLSQTLLIGEGAYPGSDGVQPRVWLAFYAAHGTSTGSSVAFNSLNPVNCVERYGGSLWWETAWHDDCALSMHSGICNFVFADGSARSLSENIDPVVFRDLGNIADGRLPGSF